MKFKIVHEIKGRMRIHVAQRKMTFKEADILEYYLSNQKNITSVKVYERNQDVAICYTKDRDAVICILQQFSYETANVPEHIWQNSGREMNREYWDKLVELDGTAITVSLLRGDMKTAGSVMFLLGIGEILEEWTHKKSVDDLARSMSLNISKVWLLSGEKEVLVDTNTVKPGDKIVIHMGNVVPFDGIVVDGTGAVKQSSMTGESLPVSKGIGGYVYAGTVLEEGELTVQVKETSGSNKYEKIVMMIEESEKLKSSMEGQAAHLADKLVPYTLLGTGLVYLLTRNVTKALSVLMVDFSCALKLAMPITVLSAIRETSTH